MAGSEEAGSPAKGGFGSASMQSVRSFLKGRSLPGTVRLSRTDRAAPGGAGGNSPSLPPRPNASAAAAVEASGSPSHATLRPDSTAQPSSAPVSRTNSAASQLAKEAAVAGLLTEGAASPSSGTTSPTVGSPMAADREPAAAAAPKAPESRSMYAARVEKFQRLLGERVVDLDTLRELTWSGCPPPLRADCWRLLLGYLPPSKDRREAMLARKRREYRDYLPQFYDVAPSERTEEEANALRQVVVDVPRTAPEVAFFHQAPVQKSLERILYIWGVRHPASGYVQGINDLVTPFLAVFLGQHFARNASMADWDLGALSDEAMLEVEADSYWCLCKLLDGIQDHYTYAQPGIQRTVFHLKELVRRIDEPVARHLDSESVDFLQFSFRWINCLLIREVPFGLAMRLWDTYLAEGSRLKGFLIYLAAAFLLSWSGPLRTMDFQACIRLCMSLKVSALIGLLIYVAAALLPSWSRPPHTMDFQDIVLFLQKPSTAEWGEHDVESMLARAYLWRASFGDARSHLTER